MLTWGKKNVEWSRRFVSNPSTNRTTRYVAEQGWCVCKLGWQCSVLSSMLKPEISDIGEASDDFISHRGLEYP